MNKRLSLFIIACLCGILLVGCGKTEEPVMTVPLIEQELVVPSEPDAEEDVAAPVEPALVVKKSTEGYVSPEERLSPELQAMTKEIIAKAWQAVRQEEWIVETYFSENLVLAGENAGTYYYHMGRVFNTVTGEYQYWATGLINDPVFDEQDIEKETYIVLEDGGYITYHRTFCEPDERLVGYDYAQECEGGKWVYTNRTGYGPRGYSPVDDMSDWQLSLVCTGDIQEVNGYSCYVLTAVVNTWGEIGYVYIDTETFLVRLIKEVLTKEAGEYEASWSTTTYEYENPNHELPSWTKDAILDEEPYDDQGFDGFFTDIEKIGTEPWRSLELDSERVSLGPTSFRPSASASVIFEDVDGYVERALLADIYIVNSENLKFEKKGVDKEFLLAPNQFAVCAIRSDDYMYDLFLHNPSSEPIAIKDCIIFAAAWTGGYVRSVPDEYLSYLSFDLMFGVAEHQTISDGVFTSRWESDEYIAWTVSEYPNILVLQDKEGPDLLKIIHECGI